MWSGKGDRSISHHVTFEGKFENPPLIQLSISMMDAASDQYVRYQLQPKNITTEGFDIVFKTWLDSRFARVRVDWMAVGELRDEALWDL